MFKLMWGTFRFLIFLIILILIFHNLAARQALRWGLSWRLGVPVEIESARVDFLGSQVMYRGVVIKNPEDFPEGYVVKMPYLTLDLDSGAFFDGRLRFKRIEADISDFQILRAPRGRVNWLNLKVIQDLQRQSGAGKETKITVEHFVLTLRRVSYRDLSSATSEAKIFMTDLEERDYLNVFSFERMTQIISWEALKAMQMEKLGAGVWNALTVETSEQEAYRKVNF